MHYAITNHAEREKLAAAGLEKASKYTWQSTAQKTFEIYREASARKSSQVKIPVSGAKKRIAWFSPLPPAESGIAGYSYEILTLLQNHADIDIYIDTDYTPDVPKLTKCEIYPYVKFGHARQEYDTIIYQMGASTFHVYFWEIMKTHPGIIVNHDANYHNVLITLYLSGDITKETYEAYLVKEFGKTAGTAIFNEIVADPGRWQLYPACNYFSGDSKTQIVLTSYNKSKLLMKEIGTNVSVVPLHCCLPDNFNGLNAAEIKNKLKLPQDSVVIASFGSIHPSKRNLETLYAFGKALETLDNIYLFFVGFSEPNFHKELLSVVNKNSRLKKHVIFTDTISDEKFYEYLRITDIFIGLRSQGFSTSGTLIKALGAGLPCVVSDMGAFDEVDDDCVVKIAADKDEISNMAKAINSLASDKNARKSLSEKAVKLANERFSLQSAITGYLDVINSADNDKIVLGNSDIENLLEYFQHDLKPNSDLVFEFSKEIAKLNLVKRTKDESFLGMKLSGIGDSSLENTVNNAVKEAGYSRFEMADTRKPLEYSMSDYQRDDADV
jgi:glycosyltransferase involved in cell wall biosynthesis